MTSLNTNTAFKALIKIAVLVTAISALASCQAGSPDIQSLGNLENTFSLNQNLMMMRNKTNSQSFKLNGRCDFATSDIEISFDGQTYSSVMPFVSSSNMNCTTSGTFQVTIEPTRDGGFNIPATSNHKILMFRGVGQFGVTTPQSLRMEVSVDNFISAGTSTTTTTVGGNTYVLKGRIQQGFSSTSPNGLKLQGHIKIK